MPIIATSMVASVPRVKPVSPRLVSSHGTQANTSTPTTLPSA